MKRRVSVDGGTEREKRGRERKVLYQSRFWSLITCAFQQRLLSAHYKLLSSCGGGERKEQEQEKQREGGRAFQTVCDKVACTDRIKHVSSDKCLDIRSSVLGVVRERTEGKGCRSVPKGG